MKHQHSIYPFLVSHEYLDTCQCNQPYRQHSQIDRVLKSVIKLIITRIRENGKQNMTGHFRVLAPKSAKEWALANECLRARLSHIIALSLTGLVGCMVNTHAILFVRSQKSKLIITASDQGKNEFLMFRPGNRCSGFNLSCSMHSARQFTRHRKIRGEIWTARCLGQFSSTLSVFLSTSLNIPMTCLNRVYPYFFDIVVELTHQE